MTAITPDFDSIKKAQRAGWETSDYTRVGNTLQLMAERLVESADVRAGQRTLDVGSGQGNAALAAARRFAEATGADYATNLLEKGRARAAVEGLPVTFVEADAEDLPFPDQSFDLVMSTVGVMFAPNHERSADELTRVTAKGGRIALASWTPQSLVGDMFRVIGSYNPPPAGVRSPMLWGTAEHLNAIFGDRVKWTVRERDFVFRYHSPEHFASWFVEFYGPITRLSGSLDDDRQASFAADLAAAARKHNVADDGTLVAPAPYLEAVGVVTH